MALSVKLVVGVLCFMSLACANNRSFTAVDQRDWSETVQSDSTLRYRVYLVGATAGSSSNSKLFVHLADELGHESKQSTIVFLGSTTMHGMPDSSTANRAATEDHVKDILKLTKGFAGRTIIIPGEGDWNNGRTGGLDDLNRLEKVVDDLSDKNTFRPDDGFPGPEVLKLADGFRLVAIDSQWWLADRERPFGETDDYELQEPGDFLIRVQETLDDYADETLLFVSHHPLVSNGERGGRFPLRTHLFPLTDIAKPLYLPLPIIGSLFPLYTRLVGRRQDLASAQYRSFRAAMTTLLQEHPRTVYAASHEPNTQYSIIASGKNNLHHIIPGSVGETRPSTRSGATVFKGSFDGYSVVSYYEDGSTWLEIIGRESDEAAFRSVFRTQMIGAVPERTIERVEPDAGTTEELPSFKDSVVVVQANPEYSARPIKAFLMGAHHRETWALPVKVPVFDIGTAFGGLTPIKRGGGQQTVSLRLENPDGRQYVLRSVDKRPENSIPLVFRKTLARDIVRDQTSAQYPYGAFAVAGLADAAGVFRTSPELVFVPDDPRLGRFRATFANQLMMLEDRPDDDMSDKPNYGFSKKVVSTGKLYEGLLSDNDTRVDQRAFLRTRLFDMLLSDWDRHRDQWRWATFKNSDETIFRPIPRDRDWAFNEWDGVFPVLISYFDPKFRGFKEDYGSLKGLTKNGYEQDRRFLNSLERSDWLEIADSIRASLTDDVIMASFRGLPEEAFEKDGRTLTGILKVRRDGLKQVAADYYKLQARIVDVVGSNKHEEFAVERGPDGVTTVVVYKIKKDGERRRELYRRQFIEDETDEIRLYGLGGNDRFNITGVAKEGIRINIIGGTGTDSFVDRSSVYGSSKLTRIYDTKQGNEWSTSGETRVIATDNPLVNQYDQRTSYSHNARLPALYFRLNRDDGIYIGGGINSIRHGFRKRPFASSNKYIANVAMKTGSYNVVYSGRFTSLIGGLDVEVDGHAYSPKSVRNYYGLGNETANNASDSNFYQAPIQRYGGSIRFDPSSGRRAVISVGPIFEMINVGEDTTRFSVQPQEGLSPTTFSNQLFTGAIADATFSTLDNGVNPHVGIHWKSTATYNVGLTENTNDYAKFETDLALFLSLSSSPQFTTAVRFGGRHTIGDFPFFDAATLGSSGSLRGYRNNRFAGRSSAFTNAEIRMKLIDISSILAVGELGILGFVDAGRVWTDGESSSQVHSGYGGGVWFNYADLFVLQMSLAVSDEGNNELIGFGFQF